MAGKNLPYGKEDQTESDYVILEQQVQSQSLQKCTEDNLELLTTTEHIQTKTMKKKINNQYLEKNIKQNQLISYLNSQYNHHC